MANLSGVVKRIINYTTANPEDTDYLVTDNSSGTIKKFTFKTLKNLLFAKAAQTIETSFLNINLYRSGGVIFFKMSGFTGLDLTSTNKQIATLPEGFRPVSQLFLKYTISATEGTEIHLTIDSSGAVSVKGNKSIASGAGCKFMTCYVYAGSYPG